MKRVHFYLINNQSWYAKWHLTPYSTLVHYAIFLVFIVFVGMNIISSVKAPDSSLTAQVVKPFDDLNFNQRIGGKSEVKGEEAISALGNDISRVASFYGRSRAEFEYALRTSPDLRLSKDALLFYADTELLSQEIAPGEGLPNNPAIADIPDSQTFSLHSKPNATARIFLNFQGATVSNTSWNYAGPIVAAPFSVDTDPAFSSDELNRIKSIWRSIAEDYAPYNIDVTTEFASTPPDPYRYSQIIFTPTSEWYGSAGGVAFVGSFRWGNNTPAWVFSTLLGNSIKLNSEAGSHEAGHTLGLYHTASYDANCVKTGEYSYGHGSNPGWAPIMGVGYYKGVTQWTNTADYPLLASPYGCTSEQNDMGIITGGGNGVSYAPDEAGSTANSAGSLNPTVQNGVALVDRLGVISLGDVDIFKFTTLGGDIGFTVNPMTPVASNLIGNNDFIVRLLDSNMNILSEVNNSAVASATVEYLGASAGTYYLQIMSSGYLTVNDPGGYTSTGSMGQYNIVGTYSSSVNLSPIITISNPLDGATLTGSSTTVSSSALPQGNARINKMEIFIDTRLVKTSSRSPISYKWSLRNVTPGQHTILVKAYDNQGGSAEKSIVVYK